MVEIVCIIQISKDKVSSGSWVIAAPYKIKKECYLLRSCLVGARRMLLFMVEQVCLLMERFGGCVTQIYSAP